MGRYELDIKKQFDFSAAKTKQSVVESLERLGLDYIDIIQIHDVEFAADLNIIFNETLPVLEEVKMAGKAKHIGITGYPLNVLKSAILGAPGKFETVLSYTRYSLLDNVLLDYVKFFEVNYGHVEVIILNIQT